MILLHHTKHHSRVLIRRLARVSPSLYSDLNNFVIMSARGKGGKGVGKGGGNKQFGQKSVKNSRFWPILADSGRFWPILADVGRFWPISADFWPILADFGANHATVAIITIITVIFV